MDKLVGGRPLVPPGRIPSERADVIVVPSPEPSGIETLDLPATLTGLSSIVRSFRPDSAAPSSCPLPLQRTYPALQASSDSYSAPVRGPLGNDPC